MRAAIGTMLSLVLVCALAIPARAVEVESSNYGTTTNGMPFSVAMAKNLFKEAGADVTGVRGSEGGGTTIRNMLGGNMPYGEVALSAAVLAIQGGADLKISVTTCIPWQNSTG